MSDLSEVMSLIQTLQTAGLKFYHRLIRSLTLPNNAGPGQPRIVIGPDIPAALQAFYTPLGFTITACFLYIAANGDYAWDVYLNPGNFRASGYTTSGNVRELKFSQGGIASSVEAYGVNSPSALNFGGPGSGTSTVATTWQWFADGFTNVNHLNGNITPGGAGDFWFDNIRSAPRGMKQRARSNAAPVASVSSTVEVAVLTASAVTFKTGRAYAIKVRGWQTSASNQDVIHRIRSVSTVGALLGELGDYPVLSTTLANTPVQGECEVRNNTGADITEDVLWTFALRSGVTTVNLTTAPGAGLGVCYLEIWDIGAAGDFGFAVQV